MAEKLDRVRISAAELRAQGTAASNCSREQEDDHMAKKQRRRPDLQRYQRGPTQGRQRHDGEEPESTLRHRCCTLALDTRDPKPRNGKENLPVYDDSRMRGDSSNIPAINSKAGGDQDTPENPQESLQLVGAAKPKKARKPDQEFYQPGSHRTAPGKDCGRVRELDKPSPPGTRHHKAKEKEAKGNCTGGKCTQENAQSKETNRNDRSQMACNNSVEKLVSKVEKLSVIGNTYCEDSEDAAGHRGKRMEQERLEGVERRGTRQGRVREKEKSQDVLAASTECEKETNKGYKSNKVEKSYTNKGRQSRRRSHDVNKKNIGSREDDQSAPTQKNGLQRGQRSNRTKSNGAAPASKRYSKSDIRRPRTYSSSSASSAAGPVAANRPVRETCGSRRRDRHTDGESSSDSVEGGEISDVADDPREMSDESKGGKGRGPGILRISSDIRQATSGERHKHRPAPLGRGGGILVLPSRSDMVNPPGWGHRLLLGGTRGGTASRTRGGRGGCTRRLWDPNNPEQKPALAPFAGGNRLSIPPAAYPQLHFLDTDDETAGQQVAALAYYKFQKSDNPYCCPAPAGGQRYGFPFASMPYQVGNGSYMPAQLYRAYSPSGGGLTVEEAEQRARGELGRMLRAADAQEVQLSNLLSRDRLSADGLERMAQLRAELLGVYERVVLSDIELADSQSVDQALWKNVFYQVIERFRQLLKDPAANDDPPHIRNVLLTLLDEGAHFFDALLQKLQSVYQFKLEDYMDGMAIRARPLRKMVKYALISAQRCLICQGDIARYREQTSDSANYGKARSWYLKAQQIAPKNGRPYNQLALLAVYTKRKLDAVYYYMRSLAASNPILTARESLMSLFEEAKRKIEQLEQRSRQDEQDGGSRGPAVRGCASFEEGARSEVWVRPSQHMADSEQDAELSGLSASDLNKRFILTFLHAHGKLFTKVGMESYPRVSQQVVQEFRALLQNGSSLLGSMQLLQIVTINMFTIHNALTRGGTEEEGGGGECRSMLQEQSTALGLAIFALMVQRCTQMLTDRLKASMFTSDVKQEDKGELDALLKVSDFPSDLRELLPGIKVWSDWMLGHPAQWNPPPCSIANSLDVWQCLACLCNMLARVDHGEVPLYKVDTDEVEGDEELMELQLKEDRLLAGFVPLLAAPQEPCYVDRHADMTIAADCKRVTVLKYFLEALCGQEEPLLAFKGGKYVSVVPAPPSLDTRARRDLLSDQEADVIVESSLSASEGEEDYNDVEAADSESNIRHLKARHHALTNKLVQQQKRHQKIQAVLQTNRQLQMEVRPLFLVPDTNGFIDHLVALKKLLYCGSYIVVVPLIVITELDGLAKGQDALGGGGRHVTAHIQDVQEKARQAVLFLERAFEVREPRLRALTSRGTQLESIAFRSEDTSGQQGNNDDVILSCCLHYCQDKSKDLMLDQRNSGTVRLHREVVLLTDDRNLRVKALTRNVPVRDIPAFLSWAKVG